MRCECAERVAVIIDSAALDNEIKDYFETQQRNNVYSPLPIKKPYAITHGHIKKTIKWFADKWYKCNVCGCLWEVRYADFPSLGFVRKFPDGKYYRQDKWCFFQV